MGGMESTGAEDDGRQRRADIEREAELLQKTRDHGLLSTEYTVQMEMGKEYQAIESDVVELQSMFVDLSVVVNEQQKDLDLIEAQTGRALADAGKGVDELKRASVLQKKSRKKMCCLIICILVVVGLAVALPLGLVKK